MGHREDFVASDSNWPSGLTRDERLHQWPDAASFGLAFSGKALRAAHAADQHAAEAQHARDLVHTQAVYALLEEGESVREIADHLHLSKSTVGRIIQRISEERDHNPPPSKEAASDVVRQIVMDSWKIRDDADMVRDHPRGTQEPRPHLPPTNAGGTRGPGHDGKGSAGA